MITLTDSNGLKRYLSPAAIARVDEACTSSQWHGVCAIIRTFVEVKQRANDIVRLITESKD